jgi:hypothetical protein
MSDTPVGRSTHFSLIRKNYPNQENHLIEFLFPKRMVELRTNIVLRCIMSFAACLVLKPESTDDPLPSELVALQECIQSQPASVRAELEPLIEGALEHAKFRHRVMTLARDALQRFKLDLAMAEFDLQATRRERELLKRQIR